MPTEIPLTIPVYGFRGLALISADELQRVKTHVAEPGDDPLLLYRDGAARTPRHSGRAVKKRLAQQLADRGVLEIDRSVPFGEGFNLSKAGIALLSAIYERPPSWPPTVVLLDKFLSGLPQQVLDNLCGLPGHIDDPVDWTWTTLFEHLGILHQRARTGTYELSAPHTLLEFFKGRPWLIPPDERLPSPNKTGARPSDQQQTKLFQDQLRSFRSEWDGDAGDDFSNITNGTDEDDADFSGVFADSEDWDII